MRNRLGPIGRTHLLTATLVIGTLAAAGAARSWRQARLEAARAALEQDLQRTAAAAGFHIDDVVMAQLHRAGYDAPFLGYLADEDQPAVLQFTTTPDGRRTLHVRRIGALA